MSTLGTAIDEKQVVFLTVSRLIDFFKDDRHLLHAIRYAQGRELLINLENALPSFLYSGRQDELYNILTSLVKIAIGLKSYTRLNRQIENIVKVFAEKESLYMSIGQRDHWLHVILVNLLCHLLAELNVKDFPPGQGKKAITGGPYPLGEVIGINVPRPNGFVSSKRYQATSILPTIGTEETTEPGTGEKLLLLKVLNRYFFDWALNLASLFHDCAYPFSPKLIAVFFERMLELQKDYEKIFGDVLRFEFSKGATDIALPTDVLKSNQFKEFAQMIEEFYFCTEPKDKPPPTYVQRRLKQFEHDMLSAFFVYLIGDDLLASQINEEENFKRNIKLPPAVMVSLIKALKTFYLDSAIHAIAFHHTPLTIQWEWNPVLYLLRIADVACSFARPEIEELRGRIVRLEGIKFGVDGREARPPDKGLIRIFIGCDYRNKSLSKQGTKRDEDSILGEIWKKDWQNQIPNLEKPKWMEINTQLLGKFGFACES